MKSNTVCRKTNLVVEFTERDAQMVLYAISPLYQHHKGESLWRWPNPEIASLQTALVDYLNNRGK